MPTSMLDNTILALHHRLTAGWPLLPARPCCACIHLHTLAPMHALFPQADYWVASFPSQALLLVDGVVWTQAVTGALARCAAGVSQVLNIETCIYVYIHVSLSHCLLPYWGHGCISHLQLSALDLTVTVASEPSAASASQVLSECSGTSKTWGQPSPRHRLGGRQPREQTDKVRLRIVSHKV